MPMPRRHVLCLAAAATAAAGVLATSAQAAVKSSTYSLTKVTQTSSVSATTPSVTYQAKASWRFTAPVNRYRFRVDFPAKGGNTDPFFGRNAAASGQLIDVFAQSATQSGSVTHNGNTCAFRGPAVTDRDEREVRVFIARTQPGGNPRFAYPTVEGPNALERLYDEIGFMDRNQCNPRRDVVPVRPATPPGLESELAFKVNRNTLRKAFTGKRKTVVLKGTTKTPVALSGTTIGSMTVTTTLTLKLVGSR
ncbi:MAG TPA: hypothetical protein VFG74_13770 [Miltoncostaeaceae bacterium]|jgi:hypothetical protein|nr:hypothetical protein [Miltoncostaeaceae bacterium]